MGHGFGNASKKRLKIFSGKKRRKKSGKSEKMREKCEKCGKCAIWGKWKKCPKNAENAKKCGSLPPLYKVIEQLKSQFEMQSECNQNALWSEYQNQSETFATLQNQKKTMQEQIKALSQEIE